MTCPIRNRSRLFVSCGTAAMALSLALVHQRAEAQAINASGEVVVGSASIDDMVPGETRVSVFSETAVIDWTPVEDNNGDALDFLPTGTTALFEAGEGQPDFAVLNRILPSTNGNVVVIDGNVISRVGDFSAGFAPGGFVAFYSPTGILIGSNATFDVGSLLLTTLEPDVASFQNFFSNSGTLALAGVSGLTARIQIDAGAQIAASPENAFFAVVAADVQMSGTAFVNGSHAYVAGEVVNLRYSNGLFDIEIPVGTAAGGTVMDINGTVGGPSSTGAGDNHMIYGVAAAQNDPISMFFRGNLGFEPAQSAGIVNGEIILSANYNVFGRTVDGGSIANGINAEFRGESATSAVRADIILEDFTAGSSVLAIGTRQTIARSVNGSSSVAGNLLLVGRDEAAIDALSDGLFTVTGDVLVDARDFGFESSNSQTLGSIDATGGIARISSSGGALLSIGSNALVTADALAGFDGLTLTTGSANAGSAGIGANGGTLEIAGNATVFARAFGGRFLDFITGADAIGGNAEFFATAGGSINVVGNVRMDTSASGANGSIIDPSTPSNAFGGNARFFVFDGGLINVDGSVQVSAEAAGGRSNSAAGGALSDAGEATLAVASGDLITIGGNLSLGASAIGRDNAGGTGGTTLGGRASAFVTDGGQLFVGGNFSALAIANGANGTNGGDAFGGIAGANVLTGSIDIQGSAIAFSSALGGRASFGFGGTGGLGRGGNSFFQANGTVTGTATLSIGLDASVLADGSGGAGGDGNGVDIDGGNGGDGFGGIISTPNQADPDFGGGAYLLAGGDNGTLNIGGSSILTVRGRGGRGGTAFGSELAGRGGNGFGGLAQVGLALLGGDGSVGLGSATFSVVSLSAFGIGGNGGFEAETESETGTGGNGTGGNAVLTVAAGTVTAGLFDLNAGGFGGNGDIGGNGIGGGAGAFGSLGGILSVESFVANAHGAGGFGFDGGGGLGAGGEALIDFQGLTVDITGDAIVDASGFGGFSQFGDGGDGEGGLAQIGVLGDVTGNGTITGNASIIANGFGGETDNGNLGGNGTGGTALAQALGGGIARFGSLQVTASGVGASVGLESGNFVGGGGFGGSASLVSSGVGSQLIVERNTPNDFNETTNAGGIVAALGLGGSTNAGTGIGGSGTGGTILLSAFGGGSIVLPADPAADPNSASFIGMNARGFGGGSLVEGGSGGIGTGGIGIIEADEGGTISMGTTNFTVFGVGGSSLNSGLNISGGDGLGGERLIRIANGAEVTAALAFGTAGARGGNGSGNGNGGNASSGSNSLQVNNATLNIAGNFIVFDQAIGGDGLQGGSATGGTAEVLAENATINFIPDANGNSSLLVSADANGGNGVDAGGNAVAGTATLTVAGSSLTSGNIQITASAQGGSASALNGSGGSATAGSANFTAANSTIDLFGNNVISSEAFGGNGDLLGTGGQGGDAASGAVTASFTNSQVTVTEGSSGPGTLLLRSLADGGQASQMGSAISNTALLQLDGGSLVADQILIEALGLAAATLCEFGFSTCTDVPSGSAIGGTAGITLQGNALLETGLVQLNSNAETSVGGTAQAGLSVFQVLSGSTAQISANDLRLSADAGGAAQGASGNIAGRFVVDMGGGNLNVLNLAAWALGDTLATGALPSQLIADGGNLNVSGDLSASTYGDLLVGTGAGGIIGSPAATGTTTNISLAAQGRIETIGDGSATGGLGGKSISIDAGRSILVNGNIAADNGTISLTANVPGALILPPNQTGPATITMSAGTSINAGTGTVAIQLLDGASDPDQANGAITLASIAAGQIGVRNFGASPGSDITVLDSGVLTASGTGRAIDLAALNGEVINLHGDAGLVLTGGGHYGFFAATPTGSQIGSFANYARHYNVANPLAYDALNPGGNFAAFRIVPFLTVSAADTSRPYGDDNPTFATVFTGFLPGDGPVDISGFADLTTTADVTSNVGLYTIDAALGTLLSDQGYQFDFNTALLTVTPRPITVTADNLSRIYGNANPALTFTLGGAGLVNGDQLSGALATTAGVTTGVGNVAITQGTLDASSNYALSFVDGLLTITPRPITVAADNLSRIYGNANPELTFTVGGDGLVNGDELSGALATTAGVTTGVGNVAITQGTLANSNYALSFVDGLLTITPRPITITADDLIKLLGQSDPELTFTISGDGLVNEGGLTGSLVRDPGENIGSFAIRQGSLVAGPNYQTTFVPGQLTIDAPPTLPPFNNPTVIVDPVTFGEPVGDTVAGQNEKFGTDFPEQPESPLISEEPLLDDPVASGSDASLYSPSGDAPGEEN